MKMEFYNYSINYDRIDNIDNIFNKINFYIGINMSSDSSLAIVS